MVDCFDMVLFILMLIIARLRPDPSGLKPANSNPAGEDACAPGHFSQPLTQEAHEAAVEVGVVVAFLQEVVVVGV